MLKKSELFARICDLELTVEHLEDAVWDIQNKLTKLTAPKKSTKKAKK